MGRTFHHLVLKGCKIDGVHITTLLNSMPSLNTVDLGEAATSYYYTPYVADDADIVRLADGPVEPSIITSFTYHCDAPFDRPSFEVHEAGHILHRCRPWLDDMFLEHAVLPRVTALKHANLFICHTSQIPALQLLAASGPHLESLLLVFAYGEIYQSLMLHNIHKYS